MRYLRRSAFLMLTFVAIAAAQSQVEPSKAPHFSIKPKALYEAASSVSATEGAPVAILEQDFSVSFDGQGRMVQTGYIIYKILTQDGVEGWDYLSVGWEPWHEARPTMRVRVITSDYAEHLLDQNTVTETPAHWGDYKIYSDAKRIRAPFPAISPGVVVEEEYIQRETEPLFSAGRVGRFVLGQELIPIAHSRIEIDVPKGLPLHTRTFLLNNVKPEQTESEGRVKLVFQINRLEVAEFRDFYLPPDEVRQPEVRFATGASWQAVATEYSKLVDNRVNTAAVKPIVDKLIAGKSSVEAQEAAILDYVDREVRYTGIELGDGTIVPHDSAETLSKKYGDCKDKATLLVTMLRAAHIPSYIALLNTSWSSESSSELPGMGLFTHAIVYVPGAPSSGKPQSASPDLWIDATAIYARLGQLPMADQGRLALIARPETTDLIKIPESTSKDNILSEFREIDLSENGPASITEKTQPKGIYESRYRNRFADKSDKDSRESFTTYVKSQYVSEKLTTLERSDPKDLTTQFELKLTCEKARRGYTDLTNAEAAIPLDTLFSSLPAVLKRKEEEKYKSAQDKDNLVKPRTADWILDEPFQVDWNYRIVPPVGFVPKQLPKDSRIAAGPAVFTESFSAEANGTVLVHLNFDTVKRRYTVAEATELRNKVAAILAGPAIMVRFEPEAQVLFHEGKVREALASYRKLVALHPSEAIHHLQLANMLIEVGMGESARAEAREAVRLEPNSALAHKVLAQILRRDLVGRDLRAGSDIAGAVEELRAAVHLDPDDHASQGNLAILLEYDSVGRRYSPQAHMKEAIAEYEKLGQSKLEGVGLKNNLAYALFYAGDYARALKAAEALSEPPTALIVASIGALQGSKEGLAAANSRTKDEAAFKEITKVAGRMLTKVRLYKVAADFMEAGASGDNVAQTIAEAATFRIAKRHEEVQLANSPRDIVLKFALSCLPPNSNEENISKFFSRNAKVAMKGEVQEEKTDYVAAMGKQLNSQLAREGSFLDVVVDRNIQEFDPKIDGNDTTGYRVRGRQISKANFLFYSGTPTFFFVKEDGEYKLLGVSSDPIAIALEMLDRIARGDLKGAKVLLDWLSEDAQLKSGQGAFLGRAFPIFWSEGQAMDARKMKLAAASILAVSRPTLSKPTIEKGIFILENALKHSSSEQEKTSIECALAIAYSNLGDYVHLRDMASVLLAQVPGSKIAFSYEVKALIGLKRFNEAMVLADERLKLLKDDHDALKAKEQIEVGRYNYIAARQWAQKLSNQSKEDAELLNSVAWLALFTGHVDDQDIAQALKATQIANPTSVVLHILASLYAEVGKTKEAHEILVRGMDVAYADYPGDGDWYILGRIAEQLGERETAIADYRKLERPTDPIVMPQSSYWLAQLRLKSLGVQSGAASN